MGTISRPEDVLDFGVWNRLNTYRRIYLEFGRFVGGDFKSAGAKAIIGSFAAISEPSSCVELFVMLLVLIAIGVARRINLRPGTCECCLHFCSIALAILFAAGRSAEAPTYRVDLTDITTDAHPGADYLQANFDFGTAFRSIDSVSLELTMPSGYGWNGGTVEEQYDVYLRVLIHQIGFDISPHLPENQAYQIPPWLLVADTEFAEQGYEPATAECAQSN